MAADKNDNPLILLAQAKQKKIAKHPLSKFLFSNQQPALIYFQCDCSAVISWSTRRQPPYRRHHGHDDVDDFPLDADPVDQNVPELFDQMSVDENGDLDDAIGRRRLLDPVAPSRSEIFGGPVSEAVAENSVTEISAVAGEGSAGPANVARLLELKI